MWIHQFLHESCHRYNTAVSASCIMIRIIVNMVCWPWRLYMYFSCFTSCSYIQSCTLSSLCNQTLTTVLICDDNSHGHGTTKPTEIGFIYQHTDNANGSLHCICSVFWMFGVNTGTKCKCTVHLTYMWKGQPVQTGHSNCMVFLSTQTNRAN